MQRWISVVLPFDARYEIADISGTENIANRSEGIYFHLGDKVRVCEPRKL